MMAARRAAALVLLMVCLTTTRGAAQELFRDCSQWSSDPNILVGSNVTLERFGFLSIAGEIIVEPVRGNRLNARVAVRIDKLKVDGKEDDDTIEIALNKRPNPVIRLPRNAKMVNAETGMPMDFAEFRLADKGNPITEVADDLTAPLECRALPGEFALRAIVDIEDDVSVDKDPLPSLVDIGKGRDVVVVPSPKENPRLSEIGRGDGDGEPRPDERPKRSLGDLAVGPGAAPESVAVEPVPVTATAKLAICDILRRETFKTAPALLPTPFMTVGQRSDAHSAPLWTYSSPIDQTIPAEMNGKISSEPGVLDPVEIVRTFHRVDAPLLHLLRPILPGGLMIDNFTAPSGSTSTLTVRVFGDARIVGISGLAQLDTVLESSLLTGSLQILWHEIKADGTLHPGREFRSFFDLIASARSLPQVDVGYSDAATLRRFADALAKTMITSDATTDMAVWVLEGVLLPDETPAILSDTIARIGLEGNIRRFLPGDGRPRRWLHVLTGQFAQTFSESYIRGPVLRAEPPIGEVEVEINSGRPERSLLGDPGKLGLALTNHLKRNASRVELPAAVSGAAADLFFVDAADAYDRIGVLVPRENLSDWLDSTSTALNSIARYEDEIVVNDDEAQMYDLSALLLLSSNSYGVTLGLINAGGGTQQRLLRLEASGLLDDYYRLVLRLTEQLVQARGSLADDCGYFFLEIGG